MKLHALSGMKDYLGGSAEDLVELFEIGRDIFETAGFRGINTPLLEDGRLFDRSLGSGSDVVSKEMYTLEQGENRLIALRPENTAGVVRSVVENGLMSNRNQLKVYYHGPMFRHERPQSGRLRQFHQLGLEVLGRSDPEVDAEVISLAADFLAAAEVGDVTLLLNSIGCSDCRPPYVDKLVDIVSSHESEVCEDCRRRLETNPLRVLDCKKDSCQEVYSAEVPSLLENICEDCADHFQRVRKLLEVLDVDHEIDSTLVRGLDYYSRTTFEFVTENLGEQDAVLAGGRYDGLVSQLGGADVPAIGFSAGLERMMLLRSTYENYTLDVEVDCYFVPFDEETYEILLPLATACRKTKHPVTGDNLRVELGRPEMSVKAQFRRADRYGAQVALICGPQELEAGRMSVKRMDSGEQEELPYDSDEAFLKELVDYLDEIS